MDLLGGTGGPVRVAGRELPRDELLGWASAVAGEIRGADAVAVHATASLETVAAVAGGILAGVPVVPLPPDSGPAERAHILGDSGARLLLAAGGRGTRRRRAAPRPGRRAAAQRKRPGRRSRRRHRADPVHERDDGRAEGRADLAERDRRRAGRPRRGLGLDAR
ncbi:AMP-binding protein [Actinomadura madurae]|uniref:AMP-binding protein n=1 Tax=Actinomadura madurae TaxID=1993 RepID=UPI0020D204B7|nr:AMP-binding protein [Actinomadura madurae]MCP9984180.1 AMP-binding protein [Actinomadura madurae]